MLVGKGKGGSIKASDQSFVTPDPILLSSRACPGDLRQPGDATRWQKDLSIRERYGEEKSQKARGKAFFSRNISDLCIKDSWKGRKPRNLKIEMRSFSFFVISTLVVLANVRGIVREINPKSMREGIKRKAKIIFGFFGRRSFLWMKWHFSLS
ncbi:hypothetical protein [Candidatus Paracaedibacter symbiosus]|uniref:hypothetical protein n=1 Tax=Candidatus Paracaedibacter symbiosus TaxID=244582 RepID=UPI001E6174B7|nr:hypothetical protein [Candidatus Paracaedibacter symbiosus]